MVPAGAAQTRPMTNTPPEKIAPARAALIGLAVGVGAALLAETLGWLLNVLLVSVQSDEVVGANIGAGMAAAIVAALAAPALALLLLRLTRVPRPLAVVLYSLPLYIVLSMASPSAGTFLDLWLWERFPDFATATSPWVPWYLMTAIALSVAIALSALLVTRSHGRRDPAHA